MKLIVDFKCSNDHVTEGYVERDTQSIICGYCGEAANRIISPVHSVLNATSGDFPGATMKWAKNRERKIKQERKVVDNHGADAVW